MECQEKKTYLEDAIKHSDDYETERWCVFQCSDCVTKCTYCERLEAAEKYAHDRKPCPNRVKK